MKATTRADLESIESAARRLAASPSAHQDYGATMALGLLARLARALLEADTPATSHAESSEKPR